MAKFYGIIGYVETSETASGVWTEVVTERNYVGDIIKNTKRWQSGESVNDNLTINNEFSIVADGFAYQNLAYMKYIKWMGAAWKITNIDIQRPRLILSIGGVYNGNTTPAPV